MTQRGHAVEARVYAEDPSQGFVPQAGPLLLYREPQRPGLRIDSGVVEGGEVSVYYDPMMAKVIASGETREIAIARLIAGLRDFPVLGIRTNIPFLLRILEHPRFRSGTVDTGFLDGEGATLAGDPEMEMPSFVRAALEFATESRIPTESRTPNPEPRESWDPWTRLQSWRA